MKKLVSLLLCLVLMLSPSFGVSAAVEENRESFDDGSYLVVGFDNISDDLAPEGEQNESSGNVSFITRLIETIKKIIKLLLGIKDKPVEAKPITTCQTKYAKYYDSNHTLLWTVYLTGTFRYDGKTAQCTDSTVSFDIKDSDWKLISAEGTKQNDTATGQFVIRQYKLGVPLKTIEKELSLTCDKNGTIK